MKRLPEQTIVLVLFFVLSFPLFYFSYKFGNPEPIAHDFWQYYRLYLNWDVGNVIAPHNMRLVGASFVFLFYRLNLYYDTETMFDAYRGWGFLEQVYFDALLFNWICVALTCLAIYRIILDLGLHRLWALAGGSIYLLGFGTIFYELMPLTDACGVLLFIWALQSYFKKKYTAFIPLALLIFQREYILLAMPLLVFTDWLKSKDRYHAVIAAGSLVLFGAHVVLRQTVFYNSPLSFQTDISFLWKHLLHPQVSGAYFKQQFMTLNIFFLYLAVVFYKMKEKMAVNKTALWQILLLLLQANLVSFAGNLGTNVGRYFYLLVPFVIIHLVREASMLPSLRISSQSADTLP